MRALNNNLSKKEKKKKRKRKWRLFNDRLYTWNMYNIYTYIHINSYIKTDL